MNKVFKCKKCGTEFQDGGTSEKHQEVHGRKSKVVEYGNVETNRY
jgi:hypothetical protein